MADQTIDSLQVEINAKATSSIKGMDKLIETIAELKNITSGGIDGMSSVARSLATLSEVVYGLKGKSGGATSLARSLEKLQAIKIGNVTGSLNELKNAASGLTEIGASLQSIRDFGKGVTNMEKSFSRLQKLDITGMADKITELVKAIKPLTDEMIRAGSGMSNFGTQMKELASASKTAAAVSKQTERVTKTARSGFAGMSSIINLSKIGASIYVFKRIGDAIGGAVKNVNDYIENMNLFSVAMGDSAQEGQKFAQSMQDILGIDAGEAMRNMGLFQQFTTSFGVTSDKAYILSKNLTQLGYDLSSFFNLPIEEAFLKLQSGIAGEIEPLRRIGIDISSARLQQELYTLGIDRSVESLLQADKAQLRYIATIKQTTNAQGDMARTIMTPANALRVLQAQFKLAARAIGSIFIPALIAILPYAIAVTRIIGEMAAAIASFFGFEMPKINYSSIDTSGIQNATGDMEDLGDATKDTAKKMNNLISGFDELNIMQKDAGATGGGVGAGSGIGGNILGDITLPEYDMFGKGVDNRVDDIIKKLKELWEAFKADPLTFISEAIWNAIGALTELGGLLDRSSFPSLLSGIAAGLMAFGLTKNPLLSIAVGALVFALSEL